jgi:hypothetical protein
VTAVEEIEAAIEKLDRQRGWARAGEWWAWNPHDGRGNSSVDANTHDPDDPEIVVEGAAADVELIVTLHRTIDAQLAILSAAVGHTPMYEMRPDEELAWIDKRPSLRNGLDLARAITGAS